MIKVITQLTVATLAAAGLTIVAAPAASAGFLCTIDICGHVKDSGYSNHRLKVRCANGAIRWVQINRWAPCHDTNAYFAQRGLKTWRQAGNSWVRVPNGQHNVNDGQWIKVKVRN